MTSPAPAPSGIWPLCCLLALCSWLPAPGLAQSAHSALWQPPEQVFVVAWPEQVDEAEVLVRGQSGEEPIELQGREVALVPVRAGDRLAIEGEVEIGLATGDDGGLPDVLTFWSAARSPFRVPSWSAARYLALRPRAATGAQARVRRAQSARDPLAWHRYDRTFARWAGSESLAPPGPAPEVEAAGLLRQLAAIKRAFREAGVAARDVAPLLIARWLEESRLLRPLLRPYFAAQPLQARGGAARTVEQGEQAWELVAGQPLQLRAEDTGVVEVRIRTRRPGSTRLRVLAGSRVVSVIDTRLGPRGTERWSFGRRLRVALRGSGEPLRVSVEQGAALVQARGYRQRSDLLDGSGLRGAHGELERLAAAQLQDPEAAAARVLAALSGLQRGDAGARARLFAAARAASLPAALRAVALAELVGHADPGDADFAARLEEALDAAGALPPPLRGPLTRSLLQRAWSLGVALNASIPQTPAAYAADAPAVLALRSLTAAEPAGVAGDLRPSVAPNVDRHAARSGDRGLLRMARALWRHEAPYKVLPAEPGTPSALQWEVPFDDRARPSLCHARDAGGVRWSVLRGTQTLWVAPTEGTHALLRVRALDPDPALDQSLRIDGVPVAVRGPLGVQSRVAVRPGKRSFQAAGAGILARIPRVGQLPCDQLREPRRFYSASDGTYFALPAGRHPSVGRVQLQGRDADSAPAHFSLRAGSQRFVALVRGSAAGDIELPLSAEAGSIWVRGDAGRVRVAARLPRTPRAPPRQLSRSPQHGGERLDELLGTLRETTRALRVVAAREQASLRSRRAHLLWKLGYPSLGRADAQRGGQEPNQPEGPRRASTGVELPEHAADVVPLGYLSSLPVTTAPATHTRDDAGWQLLRSDASPAAIYAYFQARPQPRGAFFDLLHAVLAERANLPRTAADHLASFGRATRSPAALARAATLTADLAVRAQSQELTLQALRLAVESQRLSEPSDDTRRHPAVMPLARLSDAVRWIRPLTADRAAGTALLEHVHAESEEPTLGERVRRALLDAPKHAAVLDEGRELVSLVPAGEGLRVLGLCHALTGPRERCAIELTVDGAPRVCPAPGSEDGVDGVQQALAQRCYVSPRPVSQRVQVRLAPEERALGFVALEDAAGLPVRKHVVSAWHEIDAARHFELRVAGPTVARLRARGQALHAQTLSIEVAAGDAQHGEPLVLPAETDPATRRLGAVPGSVGAEQRVDLLLPAAHNVLRVRVDRGGALLIAELATATGFPAPRAVAASSPPVLPAPPAELAPPSPAGPATTVEPPSVAALPLTLGASAGYVLEDLGEGDEEDALGYGELNAYALSAAIEDRLWLRAGALSRVRDGYDSTGMTAAFSLRPQGQALPGLFGSGRLVLQPFDTGHALGARVSLGAQWRFALGDDLTLAPRLRATLRRADERVRALPAIDRDVYSAWSHDNPRTFALGVLLHQRPLVDTLLHYGLEARSVPDANGLDRIDARVSADLLPGAGYFPWLNARAQLSYRVKHALRDEAFVRSVAALRAVFWGWQGRQRRVVLAAEAAYRLDLPEVTSNPHVFSGGLVLAIEQGFGRGLSDHAPETRIFRDRQEEGGGFTRLRAAPDHTPEEDLDE